MRIITIFIFAFVIYPAVFAQSGGLSPILRDTIATKICSCVNQSVNKLSAPIKEVISQLIEGDTTGAQKRMIEYIESKDEKEKQAILKEINENMISENSPFIQCINQLAFEFEAYNLDDKDGEDIIKGMEFIPGCTLAFKMMRAALKQ